MISFHQLSIKPRTLAATVVLGASMVTGCSSDRMATEPDVAAVFAKPVSQVARAATFAFPASGSAIASDAVSSTYADGVCGVAARVFQAGTEYQDGNLQLNSPRAKDRNCVQRTLTITYPDNGQTQVSSGDMNVGSMGTVTVASGPQNRSMNISLAGSGARCSRLAFGNLGGGEQVTVTRTSATSWHVSALNVTAGCTAPNDSTSAITGFSFDFDVTLN